MDNPPEMSDLHLSGPEVPVSIGFECNSLFPGMMQSTLNTIVFLPVKNNIW